MREIKFQTVDICKAPLSYALRISGRPHTATVLQYCYASTVPLRRYVATRLRHAVTFTAAATNRCNFFHTYTLYHNQLQVVSRVVLPRTRIIFVKNKFIH